MLWKCWARTARPAESALPYAVQRTAAPDTAAMHLAGAYVYYADSHGFTPEGAGFVLPVAMDPPGVKGAALELERAYARRVKTPAISPRPSVNWWRALSVATGIRCCWA
jgi:hypothetical protein